MIYELHQTFPDAVGLLPEPSQEDIIAEKKLPQGGYRICICLWRAYC